MKGFLAAVDRSTWLSQTVPIALTVVVLGVLITLLHLSITVFNRIPFSIPIVLHIRSFDILVGATIYLKTSIDFAIFMGRLMSTYPGWKNRVAIEVGTAAGNAIGTILIIGLWVVFKNIHLLLGLMVLIAALVLFELAQSSLVHFRSWMHGKPLKKISYVFLDRFLTAINTLTKPVLSKIMPDLGEKLLGKEHLSWKKLLEFATTVPFILGLDDFAGYVPLFTIVNVYGFAIGVIGAHTLLNICLFLSPNRTIEAVKNEYISFAGTVAFIGLALYGLWETGRILLETTLH